MREVLGGTLRAYVALQIAEKPMPPLYAKGHHVQPRVAIVLPFGTAMLVVLNLMRLQPSA